MTRRRSSPMSAVCRTLYAALSVVALAPARGAAQDTAQVSDTTQLEDITVTATRVPVSREALASTVSVLHGDDLRARGITQLLDALRSVPGLAVSQNGSYGSLASVFLRGGESDYTKVLVDGVTVNEPGGSFDFAHLSTANIDRVEIVRGPASVLYGSDAVTGVIQIFTRTGSGTPRVGGEMRGGSFGSIEGDADLVGGSQAVHYSLGVQYVHTDGIYAINNGYRNALLSGRVVIRPEERSDVTLSLRYHDSKYQYPTDGSGNIVDQNAFDLNESTTLSMEAGRFFTGWWELRAALRSNLVNGGTDDAPDGPADSVGFYAFTSIQNTSRRSVAAWSNFYPMPGIVLTGGVDFERAKERSATESLSEFGSSNGTVDVARGNAGYYAQVLSEVAGLSVTAGGRLDDNEEFGMFGTYRVAAAYLLPSATKLRGSVGRSFKEPTFFENFATGFAVGNPDLRPERATSWEVGLEQEVAAGRAGLSASYFNQRFRDLIQYTAGATPNFVNIAAADADGLELSAFGVPANGLKVEGHYAYLHTEVVNSGVDAGPEATFVEGEPLLRRPAHKGGVGVDYTGWERGQFGVVVTYVDEADDRDFSSFPATPVTLEAYTLVGLSAQIAVMPASSLMGLMATLRVENLLDQQYQSAYGFPAPGRALWVGVRIER